MKQKRIITEDFFVGNLGDMKATDEIRDSYQRKFNHNVNQLSDRDCSALISGMDVLDEKIRKSHVDWLNVSGDGATNFIVVGLRKIIENVNSIVWKMNLEGEWQTNIQFTKYMGKGDHYDWHKDYYNDKNFNDRITERKLSIVYCLSKKSDYEGGQFQIRTKNSGVYTVKFDYGDFIVFPSDKLHRVKPLSSGTRITMVGWYR